MNKSIALEALKGKDKNATIIDGYGYDAISISANNVSITGDFKIRNGYDGIKVYSDNDLIENCTVSNNSDDGIQFGSDGYENGLKTVIREWNTNYTGTGRYADNLQEFEDSFAKERIIDRKIVEQVNFNDSAPITDTKEDHFSVEYFGHIYCPENGTYTFATDSDDASVLLIDDEEVASWYGGHGMEGGWSHSGTIYLNTGYHKFRYLMQEWEGGAAAAVGWEIPGSTSIFPIIIISTIYPDYLCHKTGIGNPVKNKVTNLDIYKNNDTGIYLWNSSNNDLVNNNASNNQEGILLFNSSSNNISYNKASNNGYYRIFPSFTSNNSITENNELNNGGEGIELVSSSYNTISNNKGNGIELQYSTNNTISSNNVSDNGLVIPVLNTTVKNREVSDDSEGVAAIEDGNGIYLYESSNNTVSSNNVLYNADDGICFYHSSSNNISYNKASNNGYYRIFPSFTSNNSITENNELYRSSNGVELIGSSYNTITGNTANSNSGDGVYLLSTKVWMPKYREGIKKGTSSVPIRSSDKKEGKEAGSPYEVNNVIQPPMRKSSHNIITNNTISNNKGNGIELDSVIIFVLNTTVKNREVSDDSEGVAAIEDENGIYLYESLNNSIINNSILNNWENGILCYSSSNNITNNIISNNYGDGIYLYNSSRNVLSNNLVSDNLEGIELQNSTNNTISSNNVSDNGLPVLNITVKNKEVLDDSEGVAAIEEGNGIYLCYSSSNNITNNTISNNYEEGIDLDSGANNNLIYHNNLIHNNLTNYTRNAEDDGYNNSWDNGPIEGGNYWSDHECDGNPSNGSQPCYIPGSANAVDWFPFQDQNGWLDAFGVDLSCNETYKSIPPGGTAEYTITVKNTGNRSDTINLTLSPWPIPPCGWLYWLNKDNITLSPDESAEVILNVSDVMEHPVGSYWEVNVTGTSQAEPTKSDSITTTTTIEQPSIFDTGASKNLYPSIFGTHNGTFTPNQTITVQKLYTYPCSGAGGHAEYARIWNNSGLDVNASWNGYVGDWHNISFSEPFTLLPNETYNYTIRTGSYPQIHHTPAQPTANGWINCTEFIDANGKRHKDWIPAIRLE